MKNTAAALTATPETESITIGESAIGQDAIGLDSAPEALTPVLIKSDPHKIELCRQAFNSGRPVVNAAYQTYNALGLDTLTVEQVILLALNRGLENHVRSVMYEANPTLVAFPISKAVLMAGMELPKDFRKVQQAFDTVQELAQDNNRWYHSMNPIQAEYYQLDENDQVVVNTQALEEFLDSAYNKYITDQRELEAHRDLKQAFETIRAVFDQAWNKQAILNSRGSGIVGISMFSGNGELVFRPELIPGLFTPSRY